VDRRFAVCLNGINYIDRQTLSVLAPYLKQQYGWNNQNFATIVIAFRVAYSVGQTVSGRLIDRIGTRKGLTITVIWYSIAAMLTSLARWSRSFAFFRFLLGAGESANWPAATKAVAEWFPKKERGWAVALFDSGSSIGGAIAPLLVIGLYKYFGGWRPAFHHHGHSRILVAGCLANALSPAGVAPAISEAEREMILRDRDELDQKTNNYSENRVARPDQTPANVGCDSCAYNDGSGLVFYHLTGSLSISLAKESTRARDCLRSGFHSVAADLGNFFGGGISSWLIRRGWPVIKARKAVVDIWRARNDSPDPDYFYLELARPRGSVCSLNVCLCGLFDDGTGASV
jgi:ACS family hexuronate transporter-like MFS transporter